MKIRTKLAVRFTFIVALLLMIFAFSIYFFSDVRRQRQFYKRLSDKSLNWCRLLAEVGDGNPVILKNIVKNATTQLSAQNITIYDKDNKQVFNSRDTVMPVENDFLNRIRKEQQIEYKLDERNAIASFYTGNPRHQYVVIASAYDKDGLDRLNSLLLNLFVGFIICVVVTMIAGWIFAGQALSPISDVIEQVEKITGSSLTRRVKAGNGTDEIAQLAFTFNNMLGRIQQAFDLQKSFVSNSSHELRTPLTAITGQLEVALMNERTEEEYRAVIRSVLDDIKSVNNLTNGLLQLTQADVDVSSLKMKKIRIDELLFTTRNDLLKRRPDYKVMIDMVELPEDEEHLIMLGSEHLLKSAFINILDNACKFSKDKKVHVMFISTKSGYEIAFLDKGVGIPQEDIEKISQPFFRGSNAKLFPGHGLGLSLAYKIVALHGGRMDIESKVNEFTRVTIRFKAAA
ncbi:MAG: sensor histidine kinase [Bacteroidia bacterium]